MRARNAISSELLARLVEAMAAVDADDEIRAVILTGADPAFCAGVDLREVGRETSVLRAAPPGSHSPWPPLGKPVIAAVNGPAVTGGLELVLNCDVAICSERAAFADTHARVGVLPGWGRTEHAADPNTGRSPVLPAGPVRYASPGGSCTGLTLAGWRGSTGLAARPMP